ncbi:UDP-N-acetylmuramoyl-tripeptide--D-alanyl-D-alanine ligase [Candidatus Parcubacteria bacterium]|nr:UDP-N-acetylmuramoyl-tripeptide--D-alanyl-D-alanine ligase [Candidatus Parcubacteria bacterium]
MNLPAVWDYQLYLLQLEQYELARYWKLLRLKGLFPPKSGLRKSLHWTLKARVIWLLACTIHLAILVFALERLSRLDYALGFAALGVWVLLASAGPCLLYTLSTALLLPADFFVKRRIIAAARRKMHRLKNIMVVAIAGSYGKTTMKRVLQAVLSAQLPVAATPESVNTPLGIARFILQEVSPDTTVLILELGEHYRGDVAHLCTIAEPNTVIITGINEAHLERMGDVATVAATVFEAVEHAKPKALVVLNADDENVRAHCNQIVIPPDRLAFFSAANHPLCRYRIQNEEFLEDGSGIRGTLTFPEEDACAAIHFHIPLVGTHALGTLVAACLVARHLGLNRTEIQIGISQIRPVEHRLQVLKGTDNILIIDDSYSGNPAGVQEAIGALSRFRSRRKIYLTPGLAETGSRAGTLHREIGAALARVADVVILIRNSVTPLLAEGLRQSGFQERRIVWFEHAAAAHAALPHILKPGDVILFQNDWGDQYV